MTLPPPALPAIQTLVQAVLAALGPSQNQRLLRLHTPLGPNVLLAERMSGLEVIAPCAPGSQAAAGFKFEVLALSTNAHLQLKDLIGQPVRLDLLTQQSRTVLRPFHGHVTAFALLGSDAGLARYQLTIEPWLSFLSHREDAWVFQDKTVMDIIDEVFTDYQSQGKLAPAWRWELADPSVYPRRSLCMQHHESDFAFVQRLLAEEGLFYWFEHQADDADTLGQHTLVIADHNGCFQPNVQPAVRFTQSDAASFKEDSLTQFNEARGVASTELAMGSWDHSSVQQMSAQAGAASEGIDLTLRDQPGAYAYEDPAQAQRITQRQLEAIQAPAYQVQALGPFRQAACATTFSLSEHPSADPATSWVTLAVQHRARNNISADLGTSLQALLGKVPPAFTTTSDSAASATTAKTPRAPKPSLFKGNANPALANASTEPVYQALLLTQDVSIPVRAASSINEHRGLVFKRPKVMGAQTAIVVGLGEPVHTDRDNRIKIQFHWQRGAQSAHRLQHAAGSNAPGDDSTGTWVRVSQAWAGDNWGGHHTPRLGQEVAVSFTEGDIDRPVVTGSVYNGQGQPDAQGNQVAGGAATATGNAASWFPGNAKAGELEGHQHAQVLAGFKSQSMEASQTGTGGYNQLVLDDSPAQSRITLGSTTADTWLQIGHLLQQNDNQRLAKRGHGLDLASTAHGALRAGSGLLLTGHAKQRGTESGALAVDVRPEMSQLQQADELVQTLVQTAQGHNSKFDAEPAADKLPSRTGFASSQGSLESTDSASAAAAASEVEPEAEALEYLHDVQIRFVDIKSEPPFPLANITYRLTLEDGSTVVGVTDDDGKTRRLTTLGSKPMAIKQVQFIFVQETDMPAAEDRPEWWRHVETLELTGVATSKEGGIDAFINYPVPRTYAAQILFEDIESEPVKPLSNVFYTLKLENNSEVNGMTDGDGKTKRVVTDKPMVIKRVQFFDKPDAYDAPRPNERRGWWHRQVMPLNKVATSNDDPVLLITHPVLRLTRPLTPGEIQMAQSIFGDAIDYSLVRVHLGVYDPSRNLASAAGNVIHYPTDRYSEDFSRGDGLDEIVDKIAKRIFIHEMAHVWQYQSGYIGTAEYNKHAKELWSSHAHELDGLCGCYPAYAYNSEKPKPLWRYSLEQQAELISHYFAFAKLEDYQYADRQFFLQDVLKDFLRNPRDRNLMPRSTGLDSMKDAFENLHNFDLLDLKPKPYGSDDWSDK